MRAEDTYRCRWRVHEVDVDGTVVADELDLVLALSVLHALVRVRHLERRA